MTATQVVMVTGATGNVGRCLVEILCASSVRVRGVTRNTKASALPPSVDLVEGDPSLPQTIARALDGVTSLFINPMAVQSATDELLALARGQGVKRVVALSATNLDDDPNAQPSRMRGVNHQAVEAALLASGLQCVALRTGAHASNSVPMWAAQVRAGDIVRAPYAASSSAPIHERDIAAVAAKALTTDALVGRRPELTGPQSLTHKQMVEILGEAIGRPLRYEEIPPDVAKRVMLERGFPFPPELIDRLHAFQAKGVGRPAETTNDVETILGRPAFTYAQWASDHAEMFRKPS
jgi:uncharacterized protein YbjT (DUF2867 family)